MKRLLYIITIGLSLTACDMDKYPLDAVSPDTFFDTENDLRLYSNSFYDALPSASDIYGEAVDNIIKMDLADEIRGTRIVPTNDGGWTWEELRNINFYYNLNYYTMTASFGRPGLEKRLVNSYLMRDGKRFTDQPGYDTMFFTEEMKGRDPRLSQTVRTPGYTRIGENETLVQEFGSTVTGYQMIKFVTERKWDTNNKDINDMPLFRFAEALLIYAEAKAELGTLTQADLDKSVKLLRDRVDMPSINMAEANANPDPYLEKQYLHVNGGNKGVILEIRRERRIELVMESFRWDDMMRWKEGATFTEQFKGMYFPNIGPFDLDGDGNIDVCIYENEKPDLGGKGIQYLKLNSDVTLEHGNHGCIVVNPHIKKTWDEKKDYLYPIPIQERLLNTNLTQNPGWNDGI